MTIWRHFPNVVVFRVFLSYDKNSKGKAGCRMQDAGCRMLSTSAFPLSFVSVSKFNGYSLNRLKNHPQPSTHPICKQRCENSRGDGHPQEIVRKLLFHVRLRIDVVGPLPKIAVITSIRSGRVLVLLLVFVDSFCVWINILVWRLLYCCCNTELHLFYLHRRKSHVV